MGSQITKCLGKDLAAEAKKEAEGKTEGGLKAVRFENQPKNNEPSMIEGKKKEENKADDGTSVNDVEVTIETRENDNAIGLTESTLIADGPQKDGNADDGELRKDPNAPQKLEVNSEIDVQADQQAEFAEAKQEPGDTKEKGTEEIEGGTKEEISEIEQSEVVTATGTANENKDQDDEHVLKKSADMNDEAITKEIASAEEENNMVEEQEKSETDNKQGNEEKTLKQEIEETLNEMKKAIEEPELPKLEEDEFFPGEDPEELAAAATKIQARFRGGKARQAIPKTDSDVTDDGDEE